MGLKVIRWGLSHEPHLHPGGVVLGRNPDRDQSWNWTSRKEQAWRIERG
jgi:hypothetical protein